MERIETNEFEEFDEVSDKPVTYAEFDVAGEGLLLPSQTRNPTFGIWPSLADDDLVVRYPDSGNSSGCPLRDTADKELRTMYEQFAAMAFAEVYCSRSGSSTLSGDSLLSRLNTAIRRGHFKTQMGKLLEVSDTTLRAYVHPTTYEAMGEYWAQRARQSVSFF